MINSNFIIIFSNLLIQCQSLDILKTKPNNIKSLKLKITTEAEIKTIK